MGSMAPVSAYNEPVTNREDILKALEAVIDPELRRSIVELDMVRSIDLSANGVVDVTVSLTTPGCPIKGHFQTSVAQAVAALEGVTHVNVYFDVLTDTQKATLQQKLGRASLPEGALAQVANVICIGSGKGGVGKSTLTANLAAALGAEGKRVGVLDADVWGYSIPRMYGLGATRPPVSAARKIVPLEAHGVKVMSIGFFVEEDAAVVWRGPMLHKALTQFLQDVEWGALDYLLVDLPPGTGDVSMTLAQLLPQARFLIVTTPQQTAQKVARRSAHMAHKVDLEIAGVIENMTAFTTPSGERFTIFGEGGGSELADELDVPLLGKVPLTMPLREQADGGVPLVVEDPDDAAAQAIRQVARGLIALSPAALPVLPLVEVAGAPAVSDQPAESRKPVGMSLPMA
jgi:ATP-binding protein involved in chromosome partitioning